MNDQKEKSMWSAVLAVGELMFAAYLIYFGYSFFSFMPKRELPAMMAIQVFLIFVTLIGLFLGLGVYHSICYVREKFKYPSSKRSELTEVILGVFLMIVGLVIFYSSIQDILHYFMCFGLNSSNYWKSSILSIAPVAGGLTGLTTVYVGGYTIVKRGHL